MIRTTLDAQAWAMFSAHALEAVLRVEWSEVAGGRERPLDAVACAAVAATVADALLHQFQRRASSGVR